MNTISQAQGKAKQKDSSQHCWVFISHQHNEFEDSNGKILCQESSRPTQTIPRGLYSTRVGAPLEWRVGEWKPMGCDLGFCTSATVCASEYQNVKIQNTKYSYTNVQTSCTYIAALVFPLPFPIHHLIITIIIIILDWFLTAVSVHTCSSN